MSIEFAWDHRKASANQKKHYVSFEEASTAFYDERALVITDSVHSVGEERFVLLGMSQKAQLLVVVHLYWEEDEIIRIVSARLATRTESNHYFARSLK